MENSDLISDSEFQGLISSAFAELYSILAQSGMRYFETEQTLDTDGTTALPAGYLSTVGVDYVVNATSGERQSLRELMIQERNVYKGPTGSRATHYAIEGTNIVLYPTPPTSQSYRHWYIAQPTDYTGSASSTSIDVVTPDGENFVVWAVAVMALAKEESDVQVAMMERERARLRVEEWAILRSLNEPRRKIVEDEDRGEWNDRDMRYWR